MKKFVVHGTFLQMKTTPIICHKKNTSLQAKLVERSTNKFANDTQPLRKLSDFKQALSTLNRLHQEAGGDQLEPIPYWKYKQWTGIEFFLHLVAMERILVVFLRNQRKSRKKRQAKACDRTEQPVVY